ncbi:MAG: hypothetical protein A2X67_06210 [Ignavibacteria bacterium GWA2_55_11]|nr:MAG: hypothetical protein A2X67_06210 [Ignavibacteria bacterium GWA2_55_11]OGU66700.1 MAG: hypothetical protein A3C56_04765 [Ignavibacteria bacterium RIFCSPHIGHO2_02_FULL_56_12]
MAEKKKYLLRLDASLYNALAKWAADDLRSVNAQIEYVLSDAVKRASRMPEGGSPQSSSQPHSKNP